MSPAQFKVVFTGLANAGKTSIIMMLNKQFHKLAGLTPTKGASRSLSEILGFPVTKWDLGGQEQYRQEYLSTQSKALLEADLLVMVIDIQDWNNYDNALEYYNKVLERLKKNDENPYILIYIHKADPEIYRNYKKNINDLMKKFEEVSKGREYEFFITSIYNRRSVIEAFSYGISQFLPKKKSLDYLLKNFIVDAKQSGEKVTGMMLWDQNAYFLSMVFDDKKTESNSLTASMGILETIESFEATETFSSLVLEVNKDYQFLVKKVGKLYNTIVGKNLEFDKVWKLYDEHYLTNLEEIIEKEE
ncbi:MAG: ADP-ribosylation factor-like protein [Promethearchaeota archaeon]